MLRPNSFAETTVLAAKVTKPVITLNEFYLALREGIGGCRPATRREIQNVPVVLPTDLRIKQDPVMPKDKRNEACVF